MTPIKLFYLITTYILLSQVSIANTIYFYESEKTDSFPQLLLDSIYIKSNLRFKLFLEPISEMPLFNPIDGFLVQTKLGINFNNNKKYSVLIRPRYAFNRKKLYAEGEMSGFFHKGKAYSTFFNFSVGNFLNQLNEPFRKNEQIIALINVTEAKNPLLFVENKFWKFQITQSFLSNISFMASTEHLNRTYLDNFSFKRFNFSSNQPLGQFNINDISFIQTLAFYYSTYFSITYKKGIKGFRKSESDFDFIQLNISNSIKWENKNRFDFSFISGRFLRNNYIHFNNFYHFPTGKTLKAYNPVISTFRLLDYYKFSTNNYFHRFHVQTQFDQFLLSRLAFFKKRKILENLFINIAFTESLNPFIEAGYAIDQLFKTFRLEIVTGRFEGKWLGPRIILGPVSF